MEEPENDRLERRCIAAEQNAGAARHATETQNVVIEELQSQLTALQNDFGKLRRYAPPVAEKRRRRIRQTYEVAGVVIAATGAWWVYPPAALLLVGAWMLADVIGSRNSIQRKST